MAGDGAAGGQVSGAATAGLFDRRRSPVFNGHGVTPFVEMDRAEWAALAESAPLPLSADEVTRLRGLGDPIDLDEVETIYLPLSRLLNMYVGGIGALHQVTSAFLGERSERTPFVIGVGGSVAVGKSTTAIDRLRFRAATPILSTIPVRPAWTHGAGLTSAAQTGVARRTPACTVILHDCALRVARPLRAASLE